jgi:hypothetical protein
MKRGDFGGGVATDSLCYFPGINNCNGLTGFFSSMAVVIPAIPPPTIATSTIRSPWRDGKTDSGVESIQYEIGLLFEGFIDALMTIGLQEEIGQYLSL